MKSKIAFAKKTCLNDASRCIRDVKNIVIYTNLSWTILPICQKSAEHPHSHTKRKCHNSREQNRGLYSPKLTNLSEEMSGDPTMSRGASWGFASFAWHLEPEWPSIPQCVKDKMNCHWRRDRFRRKVVIVCRTQPASTCSQSRGAGYRKLTAGLKQPSSLA